MAIYSGELPGNCLMKARRGGPMVVAGSAAAIVRAVSIGSRNAAFPILFFSITSLLGRC